MVSETKPPACGRWDKIAAVLTAPLALPPWDSSGVLPPIAPGQPVSSPRRAPYRTSLVELIERFARSPERRIILRGLIGFRRALPTCSITVG